MRRGSCGLSDSPPRSEGDRASLPLLRHRLSPILAILGVSIACVAGLFLMFQVHNHQLPTKEYIRRLVRCFDQVSRAEGIDYWLDFGTLLGSARHGGVIPWDSTNDVDVGIHANSTDKLRAAKARLSSQCGFRSIHRDDWDNPGFSVWGIRRAAFRIFYDPITPYYIDVADYEDRPGGALHDSHYVPSMFSVRTNLVLPTVDCSFEGLVARCPANTDAYLTAVYGDWRTPRKGLQAISQRGQQVRDAFKQRTEGLGLRGTNPRAAGLHTGAAAQSE